MVERLRQEVEKLEAWSMDNDPIEYANSGELYSVVEAVLDLPDLAASTLLLRALALDDDIEAIQDLLRERPAKAERVAVLATDYPDYLTRWQTAVLAGEFAHEVIVRRYLADDYEYVRRRTLLACHERFPELAEETALSWLESPEPYSPMVALDILHTLDSPPYPKAVARLSSDDTDVVQAKIRELAGDLPD